jgi:hypothetical protein
MKAHIIALIAALISMLLCSGQSAFAQDMSQSNWYVYGVGSLKCGTWKIARENKSEVQIELTKQWVAGVDRFL